MAELWDVLDEDCNKTGRMIRRGDELKEGEYMRSVHVYLSNLNGEFLIQKRSMKKTIYPGIWDVTGGAVISGEDGCEAAIREVQEEIGVELMKDTLHFIQRIKRTNSFAELWYAIADFRIEDCILQEDEVDEVRLVSSQELKEIITEAAHRNEEYKKMVFTILDWVDKNKDNLLGNLA